MKSLFLYSKGKVQFWADDLFLVWLGFYAGTWILVAILTVPYLRSHREHNGNKGKNNALWKEEPHQSYPV